jgi:type II secretory pathway component PulM
MTPMERRLREAEEVVAQLRAYVAALEAEVERLRCLAAAAAVQVSDQETFDMVYDPNSPTGYRVRKDSP